MVDFGVNRTGDTVPNLPKATPAHEIGKRLVEETAAKTLKGERVEEVGEKAKLLNGNSIANIRAGLEKLFEKADEKAEGALSAEINKDIDEEKAEELASEMNEIADFAQSNVRFTYNKDLGAMVLTVLDDAKGVERTIPPEYLINFRIKIREQIGQFLDKKL